MGAHQSMLREKGIHAVDTIIIKRVYERYFTREEVNRFEEFHIAFIDLFRDLTSILLGAQYTMPTVDQIEEFYREWKDLREGEEKERLFCDFMTKSVVHCPDANEHTLITAIVAPATAVIVKKTWKNTPVLNIIPLHYIPNFLFVPSFTLLSLIGIKMVHLPNGGRT